MFERFTDRAQHAVELAQDEARGLGHDHVGMEHLLLGLLREEDGLAARVLHELGVTAENVRPHVSALVGRRDEVATGRIPFTPGAKKALELALREALSLGHNYIGTEHLLLGLVRGEDDVGLLTAHGANYDRVRECTWSLLARVRSEDSPRLRTPSEQPVHSDTPHSRHLLAILAAFGLGVVVGKAVSAH